MPDKTMQEIAKEAHLASVALIKLIEKNYPDRNEIERRFMQRRDSTRRLIWTLALIFVALIVQGFITIGVVSTCFLGTDEIHPGTCKFIPGYEETVKRNNDLLKLIERNDRRLNRLERLERRR